MSEGQRDVQPVSSCGRLVDPGSRGEHGQASEPEENNTSWDEDSSPGGFEEASQPHETAPKGREVIFTPETLHSGGYHAQSLSSSAEIPVKAFVLGRPTPRGWNEPYTSEKNWVNVERRRVKKQDYVTKTNQLVSVKEWNCLKGKAGVAPKWNNLLNALQNWCVSSIAWDSIDGCFVVTLEPSSRTPRKGEKLEKQKGKRSVEGNPAEASARKAQRGEPLHFPTAPGDTGDNAGEAEDVERSGHGGEPQYQAEGVGLNNAPAQNTTAILHEGGSSPRGDSNLPHAGGSREKGSGLPEGGSSQGEEGGSLPQVRCNLLERDTREDMRMGFEKKEEELMDKIIRSWETWKSLVVQKEEADKKVQKLKEEASKIESAVSHLQSITRVEEHKKALHEDLTKLLHAELPEAQVRAQHLFFEVRIAEREKEHARKGLYELDQH